MSFLDFDGTAGKWKLNKEPVDAKSLGRVLIRGLAFLRVHRMGEWLTATEDSGDRCSARPMTSKMSERLLPKPLSPGAYRKDTDGPTLVYGFFGILIDDGVHVVLEKTRWAPQRRSTLSRPRLTQAMVAFGES